MERVSLIILVLLLTLLAVNVALGQAPILPEDPDQAPLDGGLIVLAVAGGALAVNKLRNKE